MDPQDGLLFNSFENLPIFYDIGSKKVLENISIRGNIILYSDSEIKIDSSVNLEDVLIIARKVVFQKNFSGSCQVFAEEEIVLQENTLLKYPSCLYVKSSRDSTKIKISEGAEVNGAIFLASKLRTNFLKGVIEINSSATIRGGVVSEDAIDLKGDIDGSIVTRNLISYSSLTGAYEINVLENVTVANNLPLNYFTIVNDSLYDVEQILIKEF